MDEAKRMMLGVAAIAQGGIGVGAISAGLLGYGSRGMVGFGVLAILLAGAAGFRWWAHRPVA